MFKKGRKREAKGLAVVYFIIGLIILMIILAVIYFALVELDYSDRIKDPEATIRSYVEMTPEPDATEVPEDYEGDVPIDVDLTTVTPTPAPTAAPTPTPTPTPAPTPEPTPFAQSLLAQPIVSGFTLPDQAVDNCEAAFTKCYVSAADSNKYMYLAGYAYLNDLTFDCAQLQTFLIVNQETTGQKIAYQATMTAGASGLVHSGAVCQNAEAADFEVYIDVSQNYKEDIYTLGLVLAYRRPDGNVAYAYYPFSGNKASFNVMAGQVVKGVRVAGDTEATEPAASGATAASGTSGAIGATGATGATAATGTSGATGTTGTSSVADNLIDEIADADVSDFDEPTEDDILGGIGGAPNSVG